MWKRRKKNKMLEKTKAKIDELLKAATDPEAINALSQCAQEIDGEIKRDGDREGLIKRQADTIRNAYLHTAVEQKGEDEGKKEAKKETMGEIYDRLFGKNKKGG